MKILSAHLIRWVRQSETHTAEPLVPEPSTFGVEVDIQKLKRCKLPGTGQIRIEVIQAAGRTVYFEIHKHGIFYLEQGRTASALEGVSCI